MKKTAYIRFSISLLLLISLLMPVATLAVTMDDGKKFFKEGILAEVAEEWDKAVEQFVMAVAKSPKNSEYRLHLVRALFNASQMYMKKGATQANEKDYAGAYISFRKAYGYDPTNELAKAEMERMVRLQKEVLNGTGNTSAQTQNKDGVKLVDTKYSPTNLPPNFRVSQKMDKLTDVIKTEADLMLVIREYAESLDLNVLFDAQSATQLKSRKLTIRLNQVTAAKALDYIFLQENLFFQRVGPRTIFVAINDRRPFFQQMVLRTFYLSNANPDDVAKVLQTAIPPQQGRSPSPPLIDKSTNSITVRDTTENIKIIESLIKALDKDRAEVVMDVAIYEVNKSDLLQFGNQIGIATGDNANLNNLGGINLPYVLGGTTQNITNNLPFPGASAASIALGLPVSNIVALQSKSNTKLIASTQIHAFNNQDSSARIGQRVPVRSAQFVTGGTTSNGGVVSNVTQYEQVGLTLKFKPIVFPNQDVQVDMEIESKDVAGELSDNPVFTERTIKGTARVQNNKTLLLASVAQNTQSEGRSGLPLLGLIPIIGRLFTAPSKNNRQVDIVIAITPKVIRAPSILPDDLIERPTGSQVQPTSSNLEAMIIQEEIDEQVALARKNPTDSVVQLEDRKVDETPTYTKTTETASVNTKDNTEIKNEQTEKTTSNEVSGAVKNNLNPIDTSVKTLTLNQTSDTSVQTQDNSATVQENKASNGLLAELQILPTLSEMKKGEKTRLAIMVRSASAFRSAVLGLKFDKDKVAVRSVAYGDVFGGEMAQKMALPFINEGGKMYVSLAPPKDTAQNSSGVLAYIEIEALADGKPQIAFEGDILNFLTADGKNFAVKF